MIKEGSKTCKACSTWLSWKQFSRSATAFSTRSRRRSQRCSGRLVTIFINLGHTISRKWLNWYALVRKKWENMSWYATWLTCVLRGLHNYVCCRGRVEIILMAVKWILFLDSSLHIRPVFLHTDHILCGWIKWRRAWISGALRSCHDVRSFCYCLR